MHFLSPPTNAFSRVAGRRILMTLDAVGGVWTYALDLVRALQPRGYEFILAVMGPVPDASQRAEVSALDGVILEEGPYLLEWMEHPWGDVARAGKWLMQLEERHRPDVIHLNGYVHAQLPWHAPVLVVGHSCVRSWWKAVKGQYPHAEWEVYREEVTKGLAVADVVVAPSLAMRTSLEACYGCLKPVRVIYNGRSRDGFAAQAKESFVFSMGRIWDEAKNMQLLLRAAAERPFPCVIAGDATGWHDRPDSWQSTRLIGRQTAEQVKQWLARAAVFALPAKYEPFGLSALEAALSGCALVLGDIPSLREIWGDAATYADPNDAGQWASS